MYKRIIHLVLAVIFGACLFVLVVGVAATPSQNTPPDSNLYPLHIFKEGPSEVVLGESITYTLTVLNHSGITLTNLVVTDALPVNASYLAGGTLVSNEIVSWTWPSLANDSVITFQFVVTAATNITNSNYKVSTDEGEEASGNFPVVTEVHRSISGLSASNNSPVGLGVPAVLTASVVTGTNVTYIWNFGDGTMGNGQIVAHPYPTLGVFTATVTAKNLVNTLTTTTAVVVERPFTVTAISPLNASIGISRNQLISATFSSVIAPDTATTRTFSVMGSQTGVYTGAYNVSDGGFGITFNSADFFKPGEEINVYLNHLILSSDRKYPSTPYSWKFFTDVQVGGGWFVDSGQRLGNASNFSVQLGDLDNDGDLDAIVGTVKPGTNTIWFNDGQGQFADSGQNLGGSLNFKIAIGDLDNDGDLDAYIAKAVTVGGTPDQVWFNDGSGFFSDSGQRLGNQISHDVALGDIDGDGDLDAFVVHSGTPEIVYLNNGAGFFSKDNQSLPNGFGQSVALGDLDNDGDLDAFVANRKTNGRFNIVWVNQGGLQHGDLGKFLNSGQMLGDAYSLSVALGDLDQDGDLDAFVGNGTEPSRVWFNDGNGVFSDSGQLLGSTRWSWGVDLGDLDGDGDLDVYVANNSAGQAGKRDKIYLNDGLGFFSDNGQLLSNDPNYDVALGDVDNDGDLDAYLAVEGDSNTTGSPDLIWINSSDVPISGLSVNNDSPTALNSSTTLTATISTGSNVSYLWRLGDNDLKSGKTISHVFPTSDVYTVIVTASNSYSSITATSVVTIEEAISGLVAVNDSPTLLGTGTKFTATISGGSNVDFTWDFGDGEKGIGAATAHTYTETGIYTAVVTAVNSVSTSVYSTKALIEVPVIGLSATSSSPTGLGDTTWFTATSLSGSNIEYVWDFGDGATQFGKFVTHTYSLPANYYVLITASNSVSYVTQTISVVIEEEIFGLEAWNDSPNLLGSTTFLSATILTGSNVSFTWDFGDGGTGAGSVVSNTFSSTGTHVVTVTAKNRVSEYFTSTKVIIDAPTYHIYIPFMTMDPITSNHQSLIERFGVLLNRSKWAPLFMLLVLGRFFSLKGQAGVFVFNKD